MAIEQRAARADFVRASLLVVSPGRALDECFGHNALRMECPSEGLDYVFSFNSSGGNVSMVLGRKMSGFEAMPTAEFLTGLRSSRRQVTAYDLNLSPRQKQALWRTLDGEVTRGFAFRFDLIDVSCVSMDFQVMRKALKPWGVTFVFADSLRRRTYGRTADLALGSRPFQRAMVRLYTHRVLHTSGDPDQMLTPAEMPGVFAHSYCLDSAGRRVPLLLSTQGRVLLQGDAMPPEDLTPLWTGVGAVGLLAAAAVLAVRARRRRKKQINNSSK